MCAVLFFQLGLGGLGGSDGDAGNIRMDALGQTVGKGSERLLVADFSADVDHCLVGLATTRLDCNPTFIHLRRVGNVVADRSAVLADWQLASTPTTRDGIDRLDVAHSNWSGHDGFARSQSVVAVGGDGLGVDGGHSRLFHWTQIW